MNEAKTGDWGLGIGDWDRASGSQYAATHP